ncbi:MAG: hypothetical protein MK137_01275 [Rickettsiales bacterium]|nr:hypothetical protein [Rickettsiales bacterium]
MITISSDAESRLVEMTLGLKDVKGHYGVHFHFSLLEPKFRSKYQIKIALNIITNLFKKHDGAVFVCDDCDIFIVFLGEDRALLEKVIFQLRYLFMDDPLAYNKNGSENDSFSSYYDISFQWNDFYHVCLDKKRSIDKQTHEEDIKKTSTDTQSETDQILHPYHLAHIETDMRDIDISKTLRQQSICAVRKKDIKPVFDEIYVSILHLRQLLTPNVDLLSNRNLFKYLTEILDTKVLNLITKNSAKYMKGSFSLNLNLSTLLSNDFLNFDATIEPSQRVSVVIEIDIADVFADISSYLIAKSAIQALGYRICIDNLDSYTIQHLNREELGCTLGKIRWTGNTSTNTELIRAVQNWGPNRLVLCRCDNKDAIKFGRGLGISLFQGRYLDRFFDPYCTAN